MIRGQNAIVTGAKGGIGRETVRLLAESGVNVWACMRNKDDAFDAFADKLCAENDVNIEPVYFDMSNEPEIKESIKFIIQQKKPIDILINNAGVAHGALLQMTSMQTMKSVFEINFFSQILIIQMVSRVMMRQKSGSIVNISSVAGLDGDAGYTAYGSSKAALAFATRTIAKELAPYNIRVNAVAPGLTQTHMMELMEADAKSGMLSDAAMKRAGLPQEIAEAIVYLASEKASFITGQILRVDGGLK
ncbi:MAG: SDR family NAD(P)-dependent oxidoreductase [Christensenella sp.]